MTRRELQAHERLYLARIHGEQNRFASLMAALYRDWKKQDGSRLTAEDFGAVVDKPKDRDWRSRYTQDEMSKKLVMMNAGVKLSIS